MAVSLIPFVFPGIYNVRCAFQTRCGGVSKGSYADGNISFMKKDSPSNVSKNRRFLLEALGVEQAAEICQVHGDTLVFEPEPTSFFEPSQLIDADGMATSRPKLALMIKTGDCQPVLVAHKEGRHIAGFHVGWRGNNINFLGSGISAFCERYNLKAQDLMAIRGPSLGPGKSEFIHFEQEWNDDAKPFFDPVTKHVDLWAMTRHQLMQAGLLSKHIFGLDLCTAALSDSFFSYRADKQSGRQGSFIWIES